MRSQSTSKSIGLAFAVIVAFTLLITAGADVSAQEFFSGRGISGAAPGTSPSLSGPFGSEVQQPASNPIAGIFKKPAFLSNIPTLSNLIPQREPGQQSLLGKMKSKTDAFFAKAFAFEKLLPGRQSSEQDNPEWDSVRQTMEATLASEAAAAAAQATQRTANANATGGSLTR